ncbi:MAG: RHS repeat-associated core domain-containing protein, partial [Gemmatimonadaceae bacterium]|nr:RHS repeat-associated core domain-containing protein [Gemmatimonadaceae bacterium]
RLTAETSTRLSGYDFANTFDGAGNALEFRDEAHTYNADNQLVGPGTYAYDGNGNPTTWGGTALTWDVENRLTAYGSALTAGYRGDGLRAWKDDGTTRTYFLYDGINVLCELDSSGTVIASTTHGAHGLLSRGSTQYQFDPLGDAVLLLDGSGAVTAHQLHDAWGNPLMTAVGPHGYRARYGYYTDQETGLIALAYRYYEPGVGRFLNRDPVGFEGGVNLYGYVAAEPIAAVDPDGLLLLGAIWGFTKSLCQQLAEMLCGKRSALSVSKGLWNLFLGALGDMVVPGADASAAASAVLGAIVGTGGDIIADAYDFWQDPYAGGGRGLSPIVRDALVGLITGALAGLAVDAGYSAALPAAAAGGCIMGLVIGLSNCSQC